MTVTAALPRSSLHLAFLEANRPALDYIIYRDERLRDGIEALLPGKGIFLGREGRLPKNPLGAFRQFTANRRYYGEVQSVIEPLRISRLILFLEGEPLERSIVDWYDGEIELWEEGLSHYVDLTSPAWYAARGAMQIATGYYPKGAMARRASRTRMSVRDRFVNGNLALPIPERAAPGDAVLFIGSPLVEDNLITRRVLRDGLARIASVTPFPVRYLPHPRENISELDAMLASIEGAEMAPQPHGIMRHAEAVGYRAFIAPVSTALLDLGAFADSLFVPNLFGQKRMHDALAKWPHNPVGVAGSIGEVASFLKRGPA